MAAANWEIKGLSYNNCNCDWGCPCQFNARPTNGDCRAFTAVRIDEGHFGDVRLDGVTFAWLLEWPGAVHEGNGTQQVIVHEDASDAQRDAVAAIVHGDASDAGANIFQVFSTTMSTTLETLSLPIEFACDVEARTARVVIPGVVDSMGEPIRNPITGATHRAQVTLPEGMEYTTAEYGSGTTKASGSIALDLAGTHAQYYHLHISSQGVIRP